MAKTPPKGIPAVTPEEGDKPAAPVVAAPPKEKENDDTVAALRTDVAALQQKLKEGELKGMSESTAHSLLEQIAELNRAIKEKGGKEVPVKPPRRWSIF